MNKLTLALLGTLLSPTVLAQLDLGNEIPLKGTDAVGGDLSGTQNTPRVERIIGKELDETSPPADGAGWRFSTANDRYEQVQLLENTALRQSKIDSSFDFQAILGNRTLQSNEYVAVDVSAGALTVTFPECDAASQYYIIDHVKGDASVNNISFARTGTTDQFSLVGGTPDTSATIANNGLKVSLTCNPSDNIYIIKILAS